VACCRSSFDTLMALWRAGSHRVVSRPSGTIRILAGSTPGGHKHTGDVGCGCCHVTCQAVSVSRPDYNNAKKPQLTLASHQHDLRVASTDRLTGCCKGVLVELGGHPHLIHCLQGGNIPTQQQARLSTVQHSMPLDFLDTLGKASRRHTHAMCQ
jgi:hypothetical protein